MSLAFYPKLAMSSMLKSKKLYLPYILTCIGMVMMFYIVTALSMDQALRAMRGGESIQMILILGAVVVGFFAVLLLFYTHSFLIKQRKKEFGLYNILGMNKINIARIMAWESSIIALVSIVLGLISGILFSKLCQLFLARMLNGQAGYGILISTSAMTITVCLFLAIFLLILLHSLRQVHIANPIELLKSSNVGEKQPKTNALLALIGIVTLGVAYWMAVSIEDPLSALTWFFVAVILVIIATYLLFIASSVAFLKLLRRNKRYYYQTKHFFSTASMIYRMRRNGAGLASICILATMVLVTISTTTCLMLGVDDMIRSIYPRNIIMDTNAYDDASLAAMREIAAQATQANAVEPQDELAYRSLSFSGYQVEDNIVLNTDAANIQFGIGNRMLYVTVIPLADYNLENGTNETLAPDEAFLYLSHQSFPYDHISFDGALNFRIKRTLDALPLTPARALASVAPVFLIVSDMDTLLSLDALQRAAYGRNASSVRTYYCFDLDEDDTTQEAVYAQMKLDERERRDATQGTAISIDSASYQRLTFYGLYGGLFFLGILLGLVFIFGAVLIMYYKQITEGYEDQDRYDILQKVGMTKREIRSSINSQVLTVFFLPLLVAGLHVVMAFPMISKLLALFSLVNTKLFALTSLACFALFALFYMLVYWATSRAYYSIVSGKTAA